MDKAATFRILVIDDNPAIYLDFQKILKNESSDSSINQLDKLIFGEGSEGGSSNASDNLLPIFQIDCASQGKEGVECVKKALEQNKPYALVFVDIRMPPGMDGVETIKKIWSLNKEIQVVICTAYSDYTWEETVQELGLSDNLLILKKPFDSVAVRQLACSLTKKWRLMQEFNNREKILELKIKDRTDSLQKSLSMLEHQATHDTLTNLPNRALLMEKIQAEINRAKENHGTFAVIFIDLDRFKLINDSFNHGVGDTLLKQIAERLAKVTRKGDTIARLSGDEFIFIAVDPDLRQAETMKGIATRILSSINETLFIAQRDIIISASLGISIYPQDGTTVENLLRNADLAMYRAKAFGGNQFQLYSPELQEKCIGQLEMESDLRRAILNKEFFLEYQPLHNDKKQLIGVEALIRWQHPQKGVLLPMDFIPLAEETGLIVPIGEWVITTVCQQNKAWQDAGLPLFPIAINIATKQFMQPHFVQSIKDTLKASKLDPKYLEIEVTENVLMNIPHVVDAIKELKKIGLNIVLDDFGTGNSSLNFLNKLPIDQLKIDQSFIQKINSSRSDEVIIQAIINMANCLELCVVAEGIENSTQLKFLKEHNCHKFQGYYFNKPMSAKQLEKLYQQPKQKDLNS